MPNNSAPQRRQEIEIPIRDESIRLGQFLKLANFVESGGDVKVLLGFEEVLVNGEIETRRGRTLVIGDVVTFADVNAKVVSLEQ